MAINSGLGFVFFLLLCTTLLHCFYIGHPVEAAVVTITDPQEVKALRIIANKLQNKKWIFSEDPCSGKGSWNADQEKDTKNMVICNYTSEDTKFHHVTHIFLKRQNLTGVVPAELANLTYLQEMDLVSNNLYGRLPKSLVNLTNLEKMDVRNNLFHGKIPKIYSRFSRLKEFYASSNNFSGKIPDFIGNWKTIKKLRLEASSLEGPIPPTFSSLSQLSELMISDLTGAGSNLSFMENLKTLKTIVLRNALIYGKIPYSIGEFNNLKILDLRFNSLTGSIPPTLEKIINANIQYLYLGNNNLSGKPPAWLNIIEYVFLLVHLADKESG
ncbi:probable LRR receptor-like serine/threonine-protein kinase At1g07650 isoform X3 [Cryptomeria japonica]|uniref:probable LRR receptor-like serine/threonine-protein kinase At1g07650 isoform X3 n=1 Tax=Cryptomeria japonica TaxID=3369 RepID=UPI0027D9D28E|nr:probable LRR receptor-like serine/threonine-protein kinase At1g07650 isoform X3 [Cryptomeria japonica]